MKKLEKNSASRCISGLVQSAMCEDHPRLLWLKPLRVVVKQISQRWLKPSWSHMHSVIVRAMACGCRNDGKAGPERLTLLCSNQPMLVWFVIRSTLSSTQVNCGLVRHLTVWWMTHRATNPIAYWRSSVLTLPETAWTRRSTLLWNCLACRSTCSWRLPTSTFIRYKLPCMFVSVSGVTFSCGLLRLWFWTVFSWWQSFVWCAGQASIVFFSPVTCFASRITCWCWWRRRIRSSLKKAFARLLS